MTARPLPPDPEPPRPVAADGPATTARRRALAGSLKALAAVAAGQLPWAARAQGPAPGRRPTPQDAEGPYYPVRWDGETDNDLRRYGGRTYPSGRPLRLSGRLWSADGQALAGARVEIWQADDTGRYRHPGDDGEGPAQRGFQGYGADTTDAQGGFSFSTVKPRRYGARPAHVHWKATAPGHRPLVTQLYFAGENAEGGVGQRLRDGFSRERDRLTVAPVVRRVGDAEVLEAVFDLVLEPQAAAR